MQDLFTDRLVNLQVHQGIARLDFARLEKLDPEKQQATFAPALRLAMPLDAFMHMAEQIDKVREAILQQAKANPPAKNTSIQLPVDADVVTGSTH